MSPLKRMSDWVDTAIPEPDEKKAQVQLGVMLEEVVETLQACSFSNRAYDISFKARDYLNQLSSLLKDSPDVISRRIDDIEFIDGLTDIIQTAVSTARTNNMDIVGACNETADSNWSKFENGKPIFLPNGKIGKGKDYFKPNLAKYVNTNNSRPNNSE